MLSGSYRLVDEQPPRYEIENLNRLLAGYDLYRAGKAPRIMFTGGWSALRRQSRHGR